MKKIFFYSFIILSICLAVLTFIIFTFDFQTPFYLIYVSILYIATAFSALSAYVAYLQFKDDNNDNDNLC